MPPYIFVFGYMCPKGLAIGVTSKNLRVQHIWKSVTGVHTLMASRLIHRNLLYQSSLKYLDLITILHFAFFTTGLVCTISISQCGFNHMIICERTTLTNNIFLFCLGADLYQLERIWYSPSDTN